MSRLARSILVMLFCLVPTGQALAQDQAGRSEVESRLKQVQAKIEREEATLAKLRKRAEEIRRSLEYVEAEMSRLASEKTELVTKQKALAAQKEALTAQVAGTNRAVQLQEEAIRRRLVSMYKLRRRASGLNYLLEAKSATDLLRRAEYLKFVARFDKTQLDRLAELVSKYEEQKKALDETERQQQGFLQQLTVLGKDYQLKQSNHRDLLRRLEEEEKRTESGVETLQKTADKLERLLAGIMGGEEPERKEERKLAPVAPAQPVAPPFVGVGLAKLHGKLLLPVEGKLVRRFGKQHHDEFVDMLFVKGLEFQTPVGTKVHTVAPGKVIFSNILPGYGNVVIIDHGERFYTLYGRLASAVVSSGELLHDREMVGVLGEPDAKGRNFYFELRVRGKPEDPTTYFKKLPDVIDIKWTEEK